MSHSGTKEDECKNRKSIHFILQLHWINNKKSRVMINCLRSRVELHNKKQHDFLFLYRV